MRLMTEEEHDRLVRNFTEYLRALQSELAAMGPEMIIALNEPLNTKERANNDQKRV